ncbi:MAG TPA: arylesterase [Gemmatimonadales bacterium]|nr:arylesterase [Gemmatimonadales bacterium]
MIAKYGIAALLVLAGCQGDQKRPGPPIEAPTPHVPGPPDPRPVVLFLGTSLTAGLGLADAGSQAYPALIQATLDSAGRRYRVVNAGESGESSAGALSRVDWLLDRDSVAVLVIETGANDALRGQNPDSVGARIQAIIDRARLEVPPPRLVVVGMEALPNLGEDYRVRFRAIFPDLARANRAALVPFLLAGVGGVDSLNQADGIHPTAAGHRIVADNVWKVLEPVTR